MITKKEVEHIARLSRLGLGEKEVKRMQKELAVILKYINQLKEVDVSGVKPTSHPVSLENVMREDEVKEEEPEVINNIIKQAPAQKKGYVRVKGVL